MEGEHAWRGKKQVDGLPELQTADPDGGGPKVELEPAASCMVTVPPDVTEEGDMLKFGP